MCVCVCAGDGVARIKVANGIPSDLPSKRISTENENKLMH